MDFKRNLLYLSQVTSWYPATFWTKVPQSTVQKNQHLLDFPSFIRRNSLWFLKQTLSLELNKGRHLTNKQTSRPAAGPLMPMPLSQPPPSLCSCHRLPVGTGGSGRRQTAAALCSQTHSTRWLPFSYKPTNIQHWQPFSPKFLCNMLKYQQIISWNKRRNNYVSCLYFEI